MKSNNNKKMLKKSPVRRIVGGTQIPRQLVSGYPAKLVISKLKLAPSFQSQPLVPYDYLNVRNSTYQTLFGYTNVVSGMSNLTSRYAQATVLRMKVTCTILNTSAVSLVATLCPVRVPVSDHSTTYYDRRQSPESKTLILSSAARFGSKGSFSHVLDVSKMWGYDVSTTNNTSFIHSLASTAPSVICTMELMTQAIDALTIPTCDIQFEIEMEVLLQGPIQPVL